VKRSAYETKLSAILHQCQFVGMMIDRFMHTYFYHRINHDCKRVAIELCAHI